MEPEEPTSVEGLLAAISDQGVEMFSAEQRLLPYCERLLVEMRDCKKRVFNSMEKACQTEGLETRLPCWLLLLSAASMHKCVCIHTCIYMCGCTYVFLCVYAYVFVFVCVRVCVYICVS